MVYNIGRKSARPPKIIAKHLESKTFFGETMVPIESIGEEKLMLVFSPRFSEAIIP